MKRILIIVTLLILLVPNVTNACACISNDIGVLVVNENTKECSRYEHFGNNCKESVLPSQWEYVEDCSAKEAGTDEYCLATLSGTNEDFKNKCDEIGYTYINTDVGRPTILNLILEWLPLILVIVLLIGFIVLSVHVSSLKIKMKKNTENLEIQKKYKKSKKLLYIDLISFIIIIIVWYISIIN